MVTILLSLLALFSAVIHITAEYSHKRRRVYVFKPLTTLLILLIVVQSTAPVSVTYKYVILVGLLFSLTGDIFLMLPSDKFVAGLVSFLGAHIFYTVAFTLEAGFYTSLTGLLPFVIYGGVMYRLLAPHLGQLKVPVIIYMAVIMIMAWQATGQWLQTGHVGTLLAFIGAILFVVSDSILALDRFRRHFWSAALIILGTYYTAQWLIALSVK